jgi:hypothetical protein
MPVHHAGRRGSPRPLLNPVAHRRSACRACGQTGLIEILDLGMQPLANAFLHAESEFPDEARFPLTLHGCMTCGLLQLVDVIDPEVLFRNYIYVTGTSETIAAHNRSYARTVTDLLGLEAGGLVVEAASNDGSLLACFRDLGVRVLGVEPAGNIAALAVERGIPTENVFFDRDVGQRLRQRHGPARAVIGNNVLAHVDDPGGFLSGATSLLDTGGLVIVEVPYLGEMLERTEYDTIYHEHLCYFSITALLRLCEAAGLVVVRIDHVPVHGGSLRVYAGRQEDHPGHDAAVLRLGEAERAAGITSLAGWRRFAEAAGAQRAGLLSLLGRLRAEGKTMAGYGAPAKGNTLLNYCGIGSDLLPFTVDRNALKVGTWTPGTHIPVLPVEAVLERQPDYLLILPWNFATEIMEQQAEYRRRGGTFILPIPFPRIVA